MVMPNNYIIVRHGESEGNVAVEAAKSGDDSYYTDKFVTTPGTQWRITADGIMQANAIGAFINSENIDFDQYFVSPYVRTRMTAAQLQLNNAQWFINRTYREREWGECDTLTLQQFKEQYPNSARVKKNNPLYWCPPGGESIAEVAENRVRNILDTLHRQYSHKNVIAVTHGETMWAHRLVLDRWNDEEFNNNDANKDMKIHNCQAIHYRRSDPSSDGHLNQYRIITPIKQSDGSWVAEVTTHWTDFSFNTYSNEELWDTVKDIEPVI